MIPVTIRREDGTEFTHYAKVTSMPYPPGVTDVPDYQLTPLDELLDQLRRHEVRSLLSDAAERCDSELVCSRFPAWIIRDEQPERAHCQIEVAFAVDVDGDMSVDAVLLEHAASVRRYAAEIVERVGRGHS